MRMEMLLSAILLSLVACGQGPANDQPEGENGEPSAANQPAEETADQTTENGETADLFAPYGEVLDYTVLRKGKPFGHHTLTFSEEGGDKIVKVDAHLEVNVGPFTPFKYDHQVTERWRDGQLQSLESTTLKDGENLELSVTREGDKLMIDGAAYQGEAPGDLIPSTYWNKALVEQDQMLNTETGEIMDITVTEEGAGSVEAAGASVEAQEYLLSSELDLYMFYEGEKWVKLKFTARDQPIEYVLEEG
ncbi:DUF6134 family protein [Euryhalocaulis caribicus]|uniref:DUF6134 family protein n=1 Tax=Euryhalocaulis caribicus TaxID=1161401 RepID=UPI00039D7F3F|nr:DUF6134 family protein [Euryhalocaulis caribicus]